MTFGPRIDFIFLNWILFKISSIFLLFFEARYDKVLVFAIKRFDLLKIFSLKSLELILILQLALRNELILMFFFFQKIEFIYSRGGGFGEAQISMWTVVIDIANEIIILGLLVSHRHSALIDFFNFRSFPRCDIVWGSYLVYLGGLFGMQGMRGFFGFLELKFETIPVWLVR